MDFVLRMGDRMMGRINSLLNKVNVKLTLTVDKLNIDESFIRGLYYTQFWAVL